MSDGGTTARDRMVDAVARAAVGVALLIPYEPRVRFFGWLFTSLVAPVAGWRRRVDVNLAHAMPELTRSERAQLVRQAPNNVGRSLIEMYSGKAFARRVASAPIKGPGLAGLKEAHAAGRPIVLMTAHIGNYLAIRTVFAKLGIEMAALYKPMSNKAFNQHYVEAMAVFGEPLFSADRKGVTGLVKHLKGGGVIGVISDVANTGAPVLSFFGKPAHTALSAADWALKYDALFLPVFALRQPDGFEFEILVENEIPPSTAETMMQRYNDVVETVVREHPGQWFWIHNRWKLSPHALDD